jgi:hypothetical protein
MNDVWEDHVMTDTLQPPSDKVHVQLTTHGVVVSIPAALIKMAIAAAGVWIAGKTGLDLHNLETYIGTLIAGGAGWTFYDTLKGSNDATRAALSTES